MSAITYNSFQGLGPTNFKQDFGAGGGVEGVDSREYKPAAAPRVQFVNPLVGCSGPRRSWAYTLSQCSPEERYGGSGRASNTPPGQTGGKR